MPRNAKLLLMAMSAPSVLTVYHILPDYHNSRRRVYYN